MKEGPPVTQRDLAKHCDVHPSTICLALRNSPTIPLATRERIRKIAGELGYQPNAAARNLASCRMNRKAPGLLPMAWLNHHEREDFWRRTPAGRCLLDAAKSRAASLGYYIDEHWLHQPHMSGARLAAILRARGVQGVLLPLQDGRNHCDPGLWKDFAVVSLYGRLGHAGIDEVCPDYFRNIDLALEQIRRSHRARIGLVLPRSFDEATHGLTRSRFLRDQPNLSKCDQVPVCLYDDNEELATPQLLQWQREHRPGIVLGRGLAAKLRAPFGCYVDLQTGAAAESPGIDERLDLVAAVAVERLADKIQRFETGPSESPQTLLLRGVWREVAAVVAA